MGLKSVVVYNSKNEITYPYLAKYINEPYKKFIVLFIKDRCGVVVETDGTHVLGTYSDGWYMSSFSPFEGSITLMNIND